MKPKISYRFRSCSNRGSVIVVDDCIESTVCQGFSRFTFSTPITKVHPYPIRSWSTPIDIWFLFVFSLFVLGGVGYDRLSESPEMPAIAAIAIVLTCIGIFSYAWIHRREEWILFSTEIDGHWVRYCRGGPDRQRFDDFTESMITVIQESTSSGGEQS